MEPYLDALRARDVVAIQTGPAGEYDLAYLLKDASTGRMLEVEYIRTRKYGSYF